LRDYAERAGVYHRRDHHAQADGGQDDRAEHAGGVAGVRAELGQPGRPPAAASIPRAISGLGPNLGISTIAARLDAITRPPLIGRNATPVTSGE
jgi:hypothetical protein